MVSPKGGRPQGMPGPALWAPSGDRSGGVDGRWGCQASRSADVRGRGDLAVPGCRAPLLGRFGVAAASFLEELVAQKCAPASPGPREQRARQLRSAHAGTHRCTCTPCTRRASLRPGNSSVAFSTGSALRGTGRHRGTSRLFLWRLHFLSHENRQQGPQRPARPSLMTGRFGMESALL